MKKFVIRIIEIYRPFLKKVFLMLVLLFVIQGLALLSPWLSGKIIDKIISGNPLQEIFILIFVVLLVYLSQSVINYYKEVTEINKFDFEVQQHVARETLNKVLSFSMGQHENQNSGVKQIIINKGEHALSAFAYTLVYDVLPMIFRIIFVTAALFYLNIVLGLIAFGGITLFISLSIYVNYHLRDNLKKLEEMMQSTNKIYSEIFRNVKLVQINAQEEKAKEECSKNLIGAHDFAKKMWTEYLRIAFTRGLVSNFGKIAVLAVGVYYVYKKVYTPGYLLVFLSWSSSAFGELGMIAPIHRRCMELYAAVKKYFTMMDIEPEVKIIVNPVRPASFLGKIEFRDITFKYPIRNYLDEEEEIKPSPKKNEYITISDVSFTILAGQKIAFVGSSGAGKSTIINLIIRAYDPDQGQIIIDNNDLRILDLKNYREAIGLVEQDVILFDNTLRYNVVFGVDKNREVTDEDLDEIAKISCIDKFYHRMEMGFDTIIGEKGVKLSGGERQRVGIARVLIKSPKILIFDEATSNLDTENEFLIRESIENASVGRTTIIIAHRLSTIKDVDNIFVLDKGKIAGVGKHKELARTCEAYKNLIKNQIATI